MDIIEERLKEAMIDRETPTIIFCRECEHYFGKFCFCSKHRCLMDDHDFCSKGEKKK